MGSWGVTWHNQSETSGDLIFALISMGWYNWFNWLANIPYRMRIIVHALLVYRLTTPNHSLEFFSAFLLKLSNLRSRETHCFLFFSTLYFLREVHCTGHSARHWSSQHDCNKLQERTVWLPTPFQTHTWLHWHHWWLTLIFGIVLPFFAIDHGTTISNIRFQSRKKQDPCTKDPPTKERADANSAE